MDKIKLPSNVWLTLAVVAIVAVALAFGNFRPSGEKAVNTTTSAPGTGTQTKPQTSGTSNSPSSPISIISPAQGDKWIINELHTIKWSKPTGFAGGIYLADATTKQLIGWILASSSDKQSSYEWDTRDVSVTRTGGAKRTLQTGNYILRITFDGKRPEIQSGPFSIILPSQVQIPVYAVTIKDFAFSPKSLTVNHGDRVTFTNNDSVTHHVLSTSFGPYELKAGQSYTMDTSYVGAGSYTYYCDIHPSMTPATLIIK